LINQLHEIKAHLIAYQPLARRIGVKINQLKAVVGVRGNSQAKKGRLLPFDQSDSCFGGAVF
jgi:hypothetical protein